MFEFLMEFSPFPIIFAGFNLEEYAWQLYVRMMVFTKELLSITGYSMSAMLSTSGSSTFGLGDIFNNLLTTIESNVIPAMASLGMAIAVVFWMVGFIEMVTEDRMSPEMFIKSFAKLAISIFLCAYASDIANAIRLFGDALMDEIAGLISGLNFGGVSGLDPFLSSEENPLENVFATLSLPKDVLKVTLSDGPSMDLDKYAEKLATENGDMNFLAVYGLTFSLMPLLIITAFAMVLVCFIVQATRILEMGVRSAFLPIAFGLIADDGWRGAGGRYIKKYIAICSQGAVLVLIGHLTTLLMNTTIQTTLVADNGGIFTFYYGAGMCLAVGIACVSVMFKSIGFINDVFGA